MPPKASAADLIKWKKDSVDPRQAIRKFTVGMEKIKYQSQ